MKCFKLATVVFCITTVTAVARAEESYDAVTSITTYSTKGGVQRDAKPAFTVTSAAGMPGSPTAEAQVRLIERLRSGDDSYLKTKIWQNQHLEYRPDPNGPLTPEENFKFAKTSGAIFVGVFCGAEAILAYAAGTAVVGLFAPFEKIIDEESTKDALFARVALIDRDGKITRAHYRAMASDRSGVGQAIYYVRRSVATPASPSFLGSYLLGEITSVLVGAKVKIGGPVLEEVAGNFAGSRAAEAFAAASTPAGSGGGGSSSGGFITMTVPDGFGGWRTTTLPRATLTPSVPTVSVAPRLEVRTIGPLDVPPFAIETAVTTFRSAGAKTVEAKEISPNVVLVTPDYYADTGALEPGTTSDRSIDNLPTGVEIHGLGSFSISR